VVTRHQLLTMLHDLLKPPVYLEVGVQYGLSLNLAVHSEWAIGIDPEPMVQATGKQSIYKMTSNEYFDFPQGNDPDQVDLAFIDGSHLWQDALRDFINISRLCGPNSVVVFDDVLPYTQEMASREMVPGDWTGDVWAAMVLIEQEAMAHGLLSTARINTFPTGTFAVWDFGHGDLTGWFDDAFRLENPNLVPADVLYRFGALEAEDVVHRIKEDLHL